MVWLCELLTTVAVRDMAVDPSMLTLPVKSPPRVKVLAVVHFPAEVAVAAFPVISLDIVAGSLSSEIVPALIFEALR